MPKKPTRQEVLDRTIYNPEIRAALENDDQFLRWEYLRVKPEGQSLVDTMNVYGQQGWEAVSVDAFHGVAYMKRWAS